LDYSKFNKAIEHLEAQHKNLSYVNSEEKKMTTLAVVENFLADAKKLYNLFLSKN